MSEQTNSATQLDTKFNDIPVELTISVGKARPTIKDLLALGESEVLVLDRQVEDEVDISVGDRQIGKGRLEEVTEGPDEGQLAVRITQLFDTQYTRK